MQQAPIGTCFARQECNTWGLSGFFERAGMYSEGVHLTFVFCVLLYFQIGFSSFLFSPFFFFFFF